MRSLAGLLFGYVILICGNSLLTTLVSLRMLSAAHSALALGAVQSCYYVGFVVGGLSVGAIVTRIGPQRAFLGFGALSALSALGYLSFDTPGVWALLRALTGFCMVGIFTSIESGVNNAVANEQRGRAFALYLAITYLGASAGQFLIGADGHGGDLLRIVVNCLFVGALIPVALIGDWSGHTHAPAAHAPRRQLLLDGFHELRRVAPRSLPACIGAGLLSSAFYAMTPVYLTGIGFPAGATSHAMGIVLIGALLSQWPVGRLSDRFGRRATLSAVASISAAASVLLVFVRAPLWVDTVLFLYVALTFTLYGVIVSDVNDRVDPLKRVRTSAMLLLIFSLGGSAGPAAASLFMHAFGPGGLFVFALGVTLGLAALARAQPSR